MVGRGRKLGSDQWRLGDHWEDQLAKGVPSGHCRPILINGHYLMELALRNDSVCHII